MIEAKTELELLFSSPPDSYMVQLRSFAVIILKPARLGHHL